MNQFKAALEEMNLNEPPKASAERHIRMKAVTRKVNEAIAESLRTQTNPTDILKGIAEKTQTTPAPGYAGKWPLKESGLRHIDQFQ